MKDEKFDNTNEQQAKQARIHEIVREWQRGENVEANFRRIFDLYHQPLERFFRRKNFAREKTSGESALDLTQETFIRVFNSIGSFRGEAPFEVWLWQIATNVNRSFYQRQNAVRRTADIVSLDAPRTGETEAPDFADENAESPLGAVLEREKQQILADAIGELSEQQQKCVRLRTEQDLSYAEIAIVLRLSVETVKAHLFQARRRLKEKLKDYFDESDF